MILTKWVADYCNLTKRFGSVVRNYAIYNPSQSRHKTGRILGKKTRQNSTFIPKFAAYLNRRSNLLNFKEKQIDTYSRPIFIFAIQDTWSRMILSARLEIQPTDTFSNFPYWFDVREEFTQAFKEYGKPFRLVLDGSLKKRYEPILKQNCFFLEPSNHPSQIGSIERFFQTVQYEFREKLTEKNFSKFVKWYNERRPNRALNGLTPKEAWLCQDAETMRRYFFNIKVEKSKKEHLTDI
jgi:hypothetical protein